MSPPPPPLICRSPVTVICFLRRIRRVCIQITVLSLSLVILLGFTGFYNEETTHDSSSSSSRKSEEKCPPAGGIKMKMVASRPATVTTNHQMQQSNRNPMGLTVGLVATAKPG